MSRNWLRQAYVELSGSKTGGGSKVVSGGRQNDLRIRFQVISKTVQTLGSAEIIITNPSKNTVSRIQQEFTKISLYAGYEDPGAALIFSGSITETQWGEKEGGTDRLLRIWSADGDTGYNQARVSKTLSNGATPQTVVDTCLESLKPFGIEMGQVLGVDLSQPKFPRGYVVAGMARDFLREVATSKKATFNLNGGKLNIVGRNASVQDSGVTLNAATGMIGQPIQTPQGIIVQSLINPAIVVDTNVKIASSSIIKPNVQDSSLRNEDAQLATNLSGQGETDGTYRVLHIETEGDTRGPPWTMTLTCIGAYTGAPNVIQAGLGYV